VEVIAFVLDVVEIAQSDLKLLLYLLLLLGSSEVVGSEVKGEPVGMWVVDVMSFGATGDPTITAVGSEDGLDVIELAPHFVAHHRELDSLLNFNH